MTENNEKYPVLEESLHNTDTVDSNNNFVALKLHRFLITNDHGELLNLIDKTSSVSLAEALNLLSSDETVLFFSTVLDQQVLGEVFSYIRVELKEKIIRNISKKKVAGFLQFVQNDDLADFVEDLPKSLRVLTLSYLPAKRRQIIENLAKFSDDTIGSIMTTEYLAVLPMVKVKDIFSKIKHIGDTLETVRHIFIVDSNNKLIGIEALEDMMFVDEETEIKDIMSKDFAYISPIADKEEAIPICKKYDLPVLPVLSKNGEMLGIITFDDVMDVVEEENTEDVYKQAGIAPAETPYLETKAFKMARSYVVWLIILLIINTFSGMIISRFEAALLTLPILTCFIPALNDSCGDAGDQTSSMVIRALATGEIKNKDYLKVALKELLAGFITAIIIAIFNFGWVMLEMNTNLINTDNAFTPEFIQQAGGIYNAQMIIAAVVSLAFLFGITCAKLLASILPIIAKACHLDPAVMSGPLIASVMDILTLLVYFAVALVLIDSIMPGELVVSYLSML